MFNWQLWLQGLMAAAVGGASTAAINVLSDPSALSRPKEMGAMAAAGAVIGALGYLKTHPPVPQPAPAPAPPAQPDSPDRNTA